MIVPLTMIDFITSRIYLVLLAFSVIFLLTNIMGGSNPNALFILIEVKYDFVYINVSFCNKKPIMTLKFHFCRALFCGKFISIFVGGLVVVVCF